MSGEPAPQTAAGELKPRSPFLLLEYYRQGDDRFAGRDDEINAVVTGVLSFDTFVLYGRSGLGKTSLLLAGVFPELEKRGYQPVYSRVLDLPLDAMRATLKAVIPANAARTILVLDQFEEFFIRIREDEPDKADRREAACRAFASMLAGLVSDAGGRLRILFSIREDYYAELEDLRTEFPQIGSHGFRLLPLTAYGARRAIVLPLEYANPPIRYEQKLLNKLVDEVARSGFDPLLLQIICTEVWREANAERPGTNELTAADFERVGGFDAIFRRYVERAASEAHKLIVRVVLDTLITAEETKRVIRLSDLLHGGASGRFYVRATDHEVEEVLEHLVTSELLRPMGEGRDRRYELLHDRLVKEVRRWLESDKDFVDFRFAKIFVAKVAEMKFRERPGYLLSKEQMAQMTERWTERLRLTSDETELLFRSSIQAGTASTRLWGERLNEFAEGTSAKLIGEMLASPDATVRAGAAQSVEILPSRGDLIPRLLHLALEDPVRAVRDAAARSFARFSSNDDLKLFSGKPTNVLRGEAATAVAVECYDQLRSPALFPWTVRRRAWVGVRKRSAKADGERIRGAMATGAIIGGIFGALWALTVGYGLAMLVRWNLLPDSVLNGSVTDRVLIAMYLALSGAAAGAALGCLAARREARRTVVLKWELLYGGPTRGVTQTAVCTVIAALAWPVLHFRSSAPEFTVFHALLLGTPGVALLAFAFVRSKTNGTTDRWGAFWLRMYRVWPWVAVSLIALAFGLMGPDHQIRRVNSNHVMGFCFVAILSGPIASAVLYLRTRCVTGRLVSNVFWTLICASGTGMLGTLFLIAFVERASLHEFEPQFTSSACILSLALLLGCFRAAVIGAAIDPVLKIEPSVPWVRATMRSVAVSCLLLSLAGYIYLFGVRSIPWWRGNVVRNGSDLSGHLLFVTPNAHYYRAIAFSDTQPLFEFHRRSEGFNLHLTPERHDQYVEYKRIEKEGVYFATRPFEIAVSRANRIASEYKTSVFTYPIHETITKGGVRIVIVYLERVKGGWMVGKWRLPPKITQADSVRSADGSGVAFQSPAVIWDPTTKTVYSYVSTFFANRDAEIETLHLPLLSLGGGEEGFAYQAKMFDGSFKSTNASHLTLIGVFERLLVEDGGN